MPKRIIVFIVEKSPERGYEARALVHSIFTEARNISKLKKNIKEAIMCHFESDKISFKMSMKDE